LDFTDLLSPTNDLQGYAHRLFFVGDGVDDLSRNPIDGELMPSVEVHATAVANLRELNGGWMREMPVGWQGIGIVGWGLFAPLLLLWRYGTGGRLLVVAAAVVLAVLSVILQLGLQIWWAWFIPVVLQTPVAFGCAELCRGGEVFISYRTSDGEQAAAMIETALAGRGRRAFLSPGNIEPGTDFAEALLRRIRKSRLVLLILTPAAREALGDVKSWVHREVAHAVKHRRRIVVIQVQTGPLDREQLPEDVGEVATLQHIVFDSGIGRRALLNTIGCL
jgi:hypothetical protein